MNRLMGCGSGWLLVVSACLAAFPSAFADESAGESVDTYARDVKPILAKHCYRCHGVKRQRASLRLDSAAGATRGGDSGPAIKAGDSSGSLLILAVTGADDVEKMPPKGPGLSRREIEVLRVWIEDGARAPREDVATLERRLSDHWSFQPIVRPVPPRTKNSAWVRNPIDSFVLARLENEGIAPSPEADRATLLRRLHLDLLGLPPSTAEVDEFLDDQGEGAYQRLVERLLASAHFGERWGRHWLDVARYADSNGYTRDFAREIWKYRDWVIDAFNRDLPFDQFVIEQIAGDLLPLATPAQRIATGFHRNTLINEEGGTDKEQFRVDAVADRVATTGVAILGLTVGCARCHDHKFDPVSQREYYQLFAFLNNCDEPTIEAPSYEQIARGDLEKRAAMRTQVARLEKKLAAEADELLAKQLEWEASLKPADRVRFPGPTQEALQTPPDERTDAHKKLLASVYKKTSHARKAFPLVDQINALESSEPKIATTMVMRERKEPRETYVHLRGNFLARGARVSPGVPAVLPLLPETAGEPNRLDFARWLVEERNPLTPRVIVNRYWQHLFGRGIVETENDFGTQGSAPTHPGLLDWLASEFVAREWSRKNMLRLIVSSATYRQASHQRESLADIDPRNYLLARQSRLRLEGEIVRDVALTASGVRSRRIGGPSVFPPQPEGVFEFTQDPKPWKSVEGPDRFRRGMYTHLWRSSPYPALMVFDFPGSNVTCTRRVRSNTPLQALTLANDLQFVEFAQRLAERILDGRIRSDTEARARFAFELCLARAPRAAEYERLLAFIREQHASFEADGEAARRFVGVEPAPGVDLVERATWIAVARVLLNLDEFITRE